MYTTLQMFHSITAYVVLGLLIATIAHCAFGKHGNKPFGETSRKIALFTLIFTHIQFLIGLILYFNSPYFSLLVNEGMKGITSDGVIRKMALEHPITNILAIIVITIGHSSYKKLSTDSDKFNKILRRKL